MQRMSDGMGKTMKFILQKKVDYLSMEMITGLMLGLLLSEQNFVLSPWLLSFISIGYDRKTSHSDSLRKLIGQSKNYLFSDWK